jgi:hypothetical protein
MVPVSCLPTTRNFYFQEVDRMSATLEQVYISNPITSNVATDLMYFVRSPYAPGDDVAMTYDDFAAQFGAAYTPAALSKTDDTNVTLSLGGTPLTSLLQAVSLTLGWTGTLSGTRGGTGVNNGASTITIGGSLSFVGAFTFAGTLSGNTAVTFPTSGTLATTAQIPAGAALTKTDDTNVTLTLGGSASTSLVNAASLTLGWTGTLSGTRGGTGVNNGSATLTMAGSHVLSGAFTSTFTFTNTTNVTFPTSGTLMSDASAIAASQLPAGTQFNTQSTNLNTTTSVTSSSYADVSGLSVAITPTSSSNKVLVRCSLWVSTNTSSVAFFQLVRGSTAIGIGAAAGSRTQAGGVVYANQANHGVLVTMEFLDSPATTSSTTYKVQGLTSDGVAMQINRSITDTNSAGFERTSSTITVCEVKV